ncbi:unnamed protein product [Urochloa decumbens]|uniref:KIB1-4 beta-propeller domain-containing protein n=1 Tax=Urochloa decumbens TaxID=240449 RepID=A0ABC9B5C2_9POAL
MATAVYLDWAGLPPEMVAMVMQALGIPDLLLLRAGAICSSWYAAFSAVRSVRFPITDAAPCLLYSARGGDNDTAGAATLYSPSNGAAFRVRLPDLPLRSRALVGSAHGWLATADEKSNLHLVNPLTGAQLALPPESEDLDDPDDPVRYPAEKLRLFLYYKVVMSCCIVLLLHRPDGEMSFACIGDSQWTQITDQTLKWVSGYRDTLYNKNDGLFYVLSFDDSMLTLDLSDPSSRVAKDILPRAIPWNDPIKDTVLTPSGDLLQVWRLKEIKRSDTPFEVPMGAAHEVHDPHKVSRIREFFLYKVDIDKLDLVELKSIREHALFLGIIQQCAFIQRNFQS